MAPRIDFSPLYNRPAPSAFQTGLSNIGGIMTAMMERRRREQELEAEQAAKAAELQFRRDQESRIVARQEAQDKQAEARATAQAQRDQQAQNIKGYEAVSKAKTPQERAFLAQLYGGTVEQAKPNYSVGEHDPLKDIDFLENVQDSPNRRVSVGGYEIDVPEDPLGFSYGINPEHERRTQQAARTQVMTMPGGQPINLPAPEEEEDIYEGAKQAIGMFPPGSLQQAELLRQIELSKRLRLDAKGTYGAVNDVQQRQASERNARIMAARQEQQFRRQGERDDERDRDAARKEFQKLKTKALAADRELASMENDVVTKGGIPADSEGYGLFRGKIERAAGGIGLMESGNPGAEISDRTKERLGERMATGRMGAIVGKGLGYLGVETAASKETALKKLRSERAAIRAKLQEHAQTYGLDPSEANLDGPGPAAKGGTSDDDARLKRMGF
jgi:hypothetical protein